MCGREGGLRHRRGSRPVRSEQEAAAGCAERDARGAGRADVHGLRHELDPGGHGVPRGEVGLHSRSDRKRFRQSQPRHCPRRRWRPARCASSGPGGRGRQAPVPLQPGGQRRGRGQAHHQLARGEEAARARLRSRGQRRSPRADLHGRHGLHHRRPSQPSRHRRLHQHLRARRALVEARGRCHRALLEVQPDHRGDGKRSPVQPHHWRGEPPLCERRGAGNRADDHSRRAPGRQLHARRRHQRGRRDRGQRRAVRPGRLQGCQAGRAVRVLPRERLQQVQASRQAGPGSKRPGDEDSRGADARPVGGDGGQPVHPHRSSLRAMEAECARLARHRNGGVEVPLAAQHHWRCTPSGGEARGSRLLHSDSADCRRRHLRRWHHGPEHRVSAQRP
mmetsp:Transcript_13409/g.49828  ORF Transcript_13409/g.49828 Transcript_13409/m.49828 type:complete len:391 (-) Transcript_13409:584-1756(-)